MPILPGAEPFLLPGGDKGVLLIHGFTASPAEMRLLGEYLQQLHYTVLAPRLCGHGTTVEEMAQTEWIHWYSAVQDGYHILRGLCSEISVIGSSMGGLLAMKLGIEYPVQRVVAMSTPIFINHSRLHLLPLYRIVSKYYPKKRRRIPHIDAKYLLGYDSLPLSGLASLLALIKQVDLLLPVLERPILVIQSKVEHTVYPHSAEHIYNKVGSADKKLMWLEKSGHTIVLDQEREYVFREIADFLA